MPTLPIRCSLADDRPAGAGGCRRGPGAAAGDHAAADGRHVPPGPDDAARLLEQGGAYGVSSSGLRRACSAQVVHQFESYS